MELRHLRYLVAVADAGTFVRAAEVLRVAQPALSRQINDLEKELGVELFEDGARKATLTDAGHAAVRIARHVIGDTERLVARARMSNQGLLGTCAMSCGPVPMATGLLAQLITRVRRRHPAITITVVEGQFPRQWEQVANGEADIMLGAVPPASHQSLMFETQFTYLVDMAVVAPDNILATRSAVRMADLAALTYLGLEVSSPDTDAIREMYFREAKRQRLEISPPRLFPSLESLLTHVRAGQGWTLMPRLFIPTLAPLVGVPIEDFAAPFRTARCWRRADARPITRTVLNELRALQDEGVGDPATRVATPDAPEREFLAARLDLRHLRSFLQVAEHGSIGRAAEELAITQPALSRQMRELEYDVGVQLLDRISRGIELTPAGEALRVDARAVLAVVDRLPSEVHRAKRGSEQRRCVIGVVPHPHVQTLMTSVVTALETRESRERVRVGTRGIMTPEGPGAILKGEVDLAIRFMYPARTPADEQLNCLRLFDDEMSCAVLATSHVLASRDTLSLRELQDVPFIFPGRSLFAPLYDVVMHQFDAVGARPREQLEFNSLPTIWAMVAQSLGWAVGFREQRHQPPAGTVVIPLRDLRLPWGAELLYRKDESRPAILATIDTIVLTARQLFPGGNASSAMLPAVNASSTVIS